jgi:hypothetical protein
MRMAFTGDPGHINQAYPLQKLPGGSAVNSNGLSKRPPQASPQEIGAIAENFERENSDSPGLLLLDSFWKPIYVSEKAVSILCYPESPRKYFRNNVVGCS